MTGKINALVRRVVRAWRLSRPVRHGPVDEEEMAAVMDGTVRGARRGGVLERLAVADYDYKVHISTAAVLRALEEEDAAVAPPQGSRLRRFLRWLRSPRGR